MYIHNTVKLKLIMTKEYKNTDRAIKFTNKRNQSEYIEQAEGELDDFRNIIEGGGLKGFPGYKLKRSAKTDTDGDRSRGDARVDDGVGQEGGKKLIINENINDTNNVFVTFRIPLE